MEFALVFVTAGFLLSVTGNVVLLKGLIKALNEVFDYKLDESMSQARVRELESERDSLRRQYARVSDKYEEQAGEICKLKDDLNNRLQAYTELAELHQARVFHANSQLEKLKAIQQLVKDVSDGTRDIR